MLKVSNADLLVSIGLDLESAWLSSILQGARNRKVMPGGAGSLVLGSFIKPLDIPAGAVSRDQGDVHPQGNPHFLLDPILAAELASKIADKLQELDPENARTYRERATGFANMIHKRYQSWLGRLEKSAPKQVIGYHKTLSYFYKRFGIELIATIEAKPGVPPTASHIVDLIKICKSLQRPVILVENYFSTSAAERIKQSVPKTVVHTVAVSVKSEKNVHSLVDLYENLVNTLERS